MSVMTIACNRKEDTMKSEEARDLFSNSAKFIQSINRSMMSATDSSYVDSLSKVFEKGITDVNFSFPPQTDFKLTEQENDSLFKLMEEMRCIKQEKLKSFVSSDSEDSTSFLK